MLINPSICIVGVAVFGVINTTGGVALKMEVAVSSSVGVGDFTPTRVGVEVNVSVGVTGVAVGMGVYVFVNVGAGVAVAGPSEKPPTEQAKEIIAQNNKRKDFFMEPSPTWGSDSPLAVRSTCRAQGWLHQYKF